MSKRIMAMCSLLSLLALLLSSCEPWALGARPQPAATEIEQTSGPAAAQPTEMPRPTATALPLPAPRLLSRSPDPGEEQPPDAPIELVFDQTMDQETVEAAFAISPTVQGHLSWPDGRTLVFSSAAPAREVEGGLQRGTRYRVTVDTTARSMEGLPLQEPVTFDFSTVGYLLVSQAIPAPGTTGLSPDATLSVVFNRPVVPLTAISRQDELPDPLVLVPPVRGEGEWLNTSIYMFRPDEGLLPATRYKGRIAAGLTDTTGAVLQTDYTWEFTTLGPAILQVQPQSGARHVSPTGVISVTFNQPMNHASVQARFALDVDGQPVDGVFQWHGGETAVASETMAFVPDRPLPRDTTCVAKLSAGAQAKVGNISTETDKTWRFHTAREPGIVKTSPKDGEKDVEPGGDLQITFASPMQREGFLEHLSILPQPTAVYTYWSEFDTEVRIVFQRKAATAYQVSLEPSMLDKFGAPLGEAGRIRFATGNLPPYVSLNTSGTLGAFSAYTETVIYATHRNVSRLDAGLYRLSLGTFMRLNSDWQVWTEYQPSGDGLVRQWSVATDAPPNQLGLTRLELVDGNGNALPPDLYYLELSAPEVRSEAKDHQPSRYMFVKSRLNLALKQTRSEALVWITDLLSGQPVAGLPVALYAKTSQLEVGGTTDTQGILESHHLTSENLWDPFFAVAGEPGTDSFGIAYNAWDEGISPWSFEVDSEFWGSEYQGYLYTDRAIYRPGQTVYFKGIVRRDDDARYSLPQEIRSLEVQVSDPQGKEIYKQKLSLSDMGTLYDEFALAQEAPLGTYYMQLHDVARDFYSDASFRVAEYRKPEYQVSVTSDRAAYLAGETIAVSAESTYYFGGPVANADVHWSVLSSDYWFRRPCPEGQSCPSYSWTDFEWGDNEQDGGFGSYGRLVAEGDTQTDAEGKIGFRVPADISRQTGSQRFTLEISVSDLTGQQVSSRTEVVVHKGEFYIGIAPRGYLAQVGETKELDLLTVDWAGKPVADVGLTVVFMEHRWYSVREQAEDGNYYWTWTTKDTPVFTTTVETDRQGQASVVFTPKSGGSYRVRAIGRDAHENEIRSSAYFWVWGGDEYVPWRRESNNRIELIGDKDQYQVGDVAEILVPSPFTGTVHALVTVERGHVMETEVRELKSNSEVLRVPITEASVPNVFVSVIIVQGSAAAPDGLANFKMGLVKLPVSVTSKELNIALTPDKDMGRGESYSPRQSATYDILVTDDNGAPVEAELSLRLADLAVLALADEPGPTLSERFWRSRGLGVRTSMPLTVSMERFNREISPRAKGGGGGEGEGLMRTNFADTAFWDPVVRTSSEGRAQVTVQLPDNLTTWRMQARAITAQTQVGQSEQDVRSTLDLLVRPVLPRFFVAGDKAELATIVHNNTAQPMEVETRIRVDGLALEGADTQTILVPAGLSKKVVWPVNAMPGDEAHVRMWAKSGDLYDGREDVLPVYHYSTPEVVSTADHLSEPGLRQELIQLPHGADTTQGELIVRVDGSLTAATQEALDYLEYYPYECTEQTVSRFLPNVITWQALDEMNLERPELRQELAQMVGVGLQRLYAQQHYDGGWGWWVADPSDPYLTAYVLQGMLEAQRAGFVVDRPVIDKAAGHLGENLPSVGRVDTQSAANRLAYQLYVLAEYRSLLTEEAGGELGLAIRLFDKRHLLSHYGQATLARALELLEPAEPGRVQTLLGDLASAAITSATGIHWEEDKPDYWNMNSDIRTTAIVLWALARLHPEDELIANVVRWLMSVRREGYWETTQSTAWSLLGLVEYMRASGELEGDFGYTLYLNGDRILSGDVSAQNIDRSQELRMEIGRLLVEDANRLVIERQKPQPGQIGDGQLYYSADLHYYLPAEHLQALNRGIIVARQYSSVDNPKEAVDTAQVGDVVSVKLTIVAPTDLYYVVVEDPLPAGCEAVDLSLKTTSVVGEPPKLTNVSAEEEDRWLRSHGWGWWWFSHSEMRDEKTALFATYLPRGTYEYTYLIRASVPGAFLVMPASAYEMYFPEVFGRSDGGKFVIEAIR